MRLLVCGSRDWTDANFIGRILDRAKPSVVIEGESLHWLLKRRDWIPVGADLLARFEAEKRGIAVSPYPVERSLDGAWPSAGHRRNARMLRDSHPDYGVAFATGLQGEPISSGTRDMVALLVEAKVPTVIYRSDYTRHAAYSRNP